MFSPFCMAMFFGHQLTINPSFYGSRTVFNYVGKRDLPRAGGQATIDIYIKKDKNRIIYKKILI
jgi:hypothetical protein